MKIKGSEYFKIIFNKKRNNSKKIVVVNSTFQIIALLIFNNKNKDGKAIFSFQEIRELTGISTLDLKNTLLPMIHPKIKVLLISKFLEMCATYPSPSVSNYNILTPKFILPIITHYENNYPYCLYAIPLWDRLGNVN